MGDESFYASETDEGRKEREREMEIERDSPYCEALPWRCFSSLCLIGLSPPSPPHRLPPPLPSSPPSCDKTDEPPASEAAGPDPLPSFFLLSRPPFPHSPVPGSRIGQGEDAQAHMERGKGGEEEELQILIHLMAPVLSGL